LSAINTDVNGGVQLAPALWLKPFKTMLFRPIWESFSSQE